MGERRGTKALELWCRRMTEGYPGVKIDNMTTSWRDGLAFCAMIHHFRPDLIDFASLNKTDVYANNELAFRTAERHLGIPALLDAEDMAMYPVPDRLSILTYLSQFYQAFGGSQGNSPTRIIPKRPANVSDRGIVSPTTTSPPKKVVVQTAGGGLVGVSRREPCTRCNLPVFLAERLHVDKKLFHRTCFRCARCSHQLNLANYYETEDGQYCCETCPDEDTSLYATPDRSPSMMKISQRDESASKLLSRSLSDEEKERGLKKFGENKNNNGGDNDDEYSSIFEHILEDSKDEKKSYTLNSKARNSFMSSQLLLVSGEEEKTEEDVPPELPKTSPPYIDDDDDDFIMNKDNDDDSNGSFRSEYLLHEHVSDENKLDDPPPKLPSSKPPDIEPGSKTYLATVLNLKPTYESVTISEESVDVADVALNDGVDRRTTVDDNDDNSSSVVSESCVSVAMTDDIVNKCSDSSNRPLTVSDDVSPTAFSFRNDRNKIVTKDTNTVSDDAKPTTVSPPDSNVSIVRMRMRMFESDDNNFKKRPETVLSSSEDSTKRSSEYRVDAVSISTEIPTKVPSLDTNRSTDSNRSTDTNRSTDSNESTTTTTTTTIHRSECDVLSDRSESNTLMNNDNLDDSLIDRDEEIVVDSPLATNDKCSSLNVSLPIIEDTSSDAIDDFPPVDTTDGEKNEINSTRTHDENVEVNIDIDDHADISLDKNMPKSEPEHETDLAASIDYPDDLNPFDDDDEEENIKVTGLDDSTASQEINDTEVNVPIPRARKSLEQHTQEHRKSTNPFDSGSDEDNNEEVSKYCSANENISADHHHPQPSMRTTGSNTSGVKSVTEAPKINLNPFWSDGEEPSDGEHESITPVPKPRASKTSAISTTPEPSPRPRKLLDKSGTRYDSSTSLSSVNSSVTHTPSGTTRKKKPAPPPPPVKELFPLDPVSGQSSQASSPCASVPHTPKLRKRPAPKPPTSISINTTVSTAENATTEPINVENGSCNVDVSIPAKSPTKSNCSNEWEKEKISKDEVNRTRQSMTASTVSTTSPISDSDGSSSLSVPNKSTYGKWKRKKGPAPARPVPQRRQIKALPVVELRRELEFIEIQQQGLEKQGVKLEQIIREKCEGPADDESTMPPEVEDLVLQLFELVNEKNELFRKQAELMYLRRQQRLEEEHADIEYQIRCSMNQPERNKTDSDKEREEELINRLVEVVERRNEIVECLEMDRIREAEEDLSINTQLSLLAAKREEEPLVVSEETPIKLSKKEKKKIKKEKRFKGKDGRNIDADKDVDETESTLASISIKEKKKKKWFNV